MGAGIEPPLLQPFFFLCLYQFLVLSFVFYARVCHTNSHCLIGKPISQYASYSAMFCLLHSNIGKEQHEKHLCNPSSHYGKYREYTREMRTPYLNT